jgi:hypothetical protein
LKSPANSKFTDRLPVNHAQKHFHAAFALPGKIMVNRGQGRLENRDSGRSSALGVNAQFLAQSLRIFRRIAFASLNRSRRITVSQPDRRNNGTSKLPADVGFCRLVWSPFQYG